MKIFCLGSDFTGDTLAHEMGCKLEIPNIEFIVIKDLDDFMTQTENLDLIIVMDVVKGIKGVQLIDDFDMISSKNICTMHDFDIGFYLKLQKELGKNIKAIGIGENAKEEDILSAISLI